MQYRIFISLLIGLSITGFSTKAQTVDSLRRQLEGYRHEDSVKLKLWMRLADKYSRVNPDKSMEAADSAIALAGQLNSLAWLANAYNIKAGGYANKGDYTQALALFQKSLSIAEKSGNRRRIFQTTNNIGYVQMHLGNYTSAIIYFQKSLDVSREMNQSDGIASALANIAGAYLQLSDYTNALDYAQKGLYITEQSGDKREMEASLNVIGGIYIGLNNYVLANTYLKRSLEISEELNDKRSVAISFSNLGDVSDALLNYPESLEYRLKALDISQEIGLKDITMISLSNIGYEYMQLSMFPEAFKYSEKAVKMREEIGDAGTGGFSLINLGRLYAIVPDSVITKQGYDTSARYDKSLELLKKGLKVATETNSLEWQRNAWQHLSSTYEKQKNYQKSIEAYKNFINIRDSMVNDKKKEEINRLSIQYEFDKKKDSLDLKQQVTDEKLKQQILLTRQRQQQLTLNQKELDLTNKEKDLQKLAYLKTQSDLQNEQLEKKGKEKQLVLSEKEKELQLSNVRTLTQEKHLVALKQQQLWLYIIGGLILLGFVSFWLFYRSRLQRVRLKTEMAAERIEQQHKEAEFHRQLGDISLSALRSQMNPHFIFNCLNSIKLYTTQNDTAAASEYLTKFSRLIRIVLENSRNDRITLASELDALRLYMEMEAMRFKEKLEYNISVEKNVDMDYIEIPPLLLQPYVENAIWHGLMQKEEGGRIDVNVGMELTESMLVINIRDNGIGRAKSAELMSKTATKHKSYGMKVTSERLALINRVYKTGANVTITDLADTNGQPSGTQVTIKIPLE